MNTSINTPTMQQGDQAVEVVSDLLIQHNIQGAEQFIKSPIMNEIDALAKQRCRELIQEYHDTFPQPKEEKSENDQTTIKRLATLSPMEYDRVRKEEAKRLGIQITTLDKQVRQQRPKHTKDNEKAELFPKVEEWPEPVVGAELLNEIHAIIKKYIICQDETAIATSLWIASTWFIDVAQVAPLAVITAPEKRCGKSQMLSLIGKLVKRPLPASNITPAALFRAIDQWTPTLLIDEADAFVKDNEELRGLLNAGHTRDNAFVIRTTGDQHEPKPFTIWGAKAIAGIGKLQDTLMDRAITLELRRKLPHESVERLRHAETELFHQICTKLHRWSLDNMSEIQYARPPVPDALNDRAQDNWEPLLAIAYVAGNGWLERARQAAIAINQKTDNETSLGSELLQDIQEIFDTKGIDRIHTTELIEALCADEEKSWATYNRGKPLSPKQLGNRLKEYNITSKTIRIGYDNRKGFEQKQFHDAFTRYLSVTTSQINVTVNNNVTDRTICDVTKSASVTLKPLVDKDCDVVTDKIREVEVEIC